MSANVQPIFPPDTAAMSQHLEHLFGGFLDGYHEGRIELAYTDSTGKPNKAEWFGTDQLDELAERATYLNSVAMCNVYIGAALRKPDTPPFGRSKDEDAWALTALYADLDEPGTALEAKNIYGSTRPTMVVVTGREPHVRAQLWWRLDEPLTDTDAWPAALRGISAKLNGDPTVCNPGRIMRLAGTIAWPVKAGRTAVELTKIAVRKEVSPPDYAVEQIVSSFPPIGTPEITPENIISGVVRNTNSLGIPAKVTDGRDIYMRDTVLAVLREYIGENGAVPEDQELFDLAWAQYAASADTTRPGHGELAMKLKVRYTLRRFERGEIPGMRTLDEAIASHKARQKPEPRVEEAKAQEEKARGPSGQLLIHGTEFLSTFMPPEYLVDGMMQRGYLYSLTARTGAGKTAVAMHIMQCIARGAKMHHRDTEQGAVLFCAGENPSDIQARYFALCDRCGFDPADAPIYFIDGVVDIEQSLPTIRAEAEKIDNLKLIIVDTAAAYFKGDDGNSNVQQGAFARVLRQLCRLPGNPAVLVPCHPVKNAGRDNLLPVGGGAFLNEVDGNLTLWADAENQTMLHWQGKFRGPEFDPVTFRLDVVTCDAVKDAKGRHMPTVVAKPIGEVEIEMGASAAETDENALLRVIALTTRAPISKLAEKCQWISDTGMPNKGKVFRVAQRLLDEKLIRKVRGKYVATDAGKNEVGVE